MSLAKDIPWEDVPEADHSAAQSAEGLPARPASSPEEPSGWPEVVERIQRGDPDGMAELYRVFATGIRFYLCRQLGPQELDDKVHDTFLIVAQAILRGHLREPERLMGFVRTVVRRQVAAHIDQVVQHRRENMDLDHGARVADLQGDPEQQAIWRQKVELMEEVLAGISRRDREILMRFYLDEQPQEQICADMNLSETQFRLLKSRAKARFGALGRRKLAGKHLTRISMRASGGGAH